MKKANSESITIPIKLHVSGQDLEILENLCRHFSSAYRTAYQRLLDGKIRLELKSGLAPQFSLNTRYMDDAILLAQALIDSNLELGNDPKKVIFGGKKLFKQLQKKHLSEKKRAEIREEYREKRQMNLYSRGDRSKKGNPNLRFLQGENGLQIRITVAKREYIYIDCEGKHKHYQKRFEQIINQEDSYTVRLKRRNDKWIADVTFALENQIPITDFSNGAIGLDFNASPHSVAWCETDKAGNPLKSGTLNTAPLAYLPQPKRDLLRWEVANDLAKMALEAGKGLVIDPVKVGQGKRGDGTSRKLRRIKGQFGTNSLREKILSVCKRRGVLCISKPCAYTTIIGVLKYAPLYKMNNHEAAALVLARRGLGFYDTLSLSQQCFLKTWVEGPLERKSPDTGAKHFASYHAWKVLKTAVLTALRKQRLSWSKIKSCPSYLLPFWGKTAFS